jgi:eukaryotic-like serine/threonine-protein kinase
MWCVNGARRRLAGRYELAEVIGRGGMGTVYRATDVVLRRSVAVKVLAAALADEDASHVARFEREARAAASLSHPGVVTVYDSGVDNATCFIVMEYIEGRGLDAIVRDEGRLAPDRAVGIIERVADALAAAHAAGIVHRDIKPANVMVADDGTVKVLDFGIARPLHGTALTQTASVVGTAAYMSPEQAIGQRADERSDVYSLGCLLYAMLAGRPPFVGDVDAAILHQHVNVEPSGLQAENRSVSPALDALVGRMLAKSPDERPRSVVEVRARLAEVAAGARTESPAIATAARTRQQERATRAPTVRHGVNRRSLAAALVVTGAALLAGAATLGSAGDSRHAVLTVHRGSTAKRTPTAAGSRTATRSAAHVTTAATTPSSSPAPPLTVAGTAGALSALITQDVQARTIDQPAAQRLSSRLADLLRSAATGHTLDVQHNLAELSQMITTLQDHGNISIAAALPLDAALTGLTQALTISAQATPVLRPPDGQTTGPPSDGAQPPGRHRGHGDAHGSSHGG